MGTDMADKKVVILMAVYNGQEYLKEQLDSIINQTFTSWELLIRDDCSGDKTPEIIEGYAMLDSRIKILDNKGKNLGAAGNFFELLKNAPDADYYAFSDQDDYWYPGKVERAVKKLEELCEAGDKLNEERKISDTNNDATGDGCDFPAAYCGAKEITDGELNVKSVSAFKAPRLTWENALVENLCTGCTCMINRKLKDMLVKDIPEYTVMHDWWIYMIAVSLGKVYYDEKPYIKYRQHSDNAYGDIQGTISLWKYRFSQLFAARGNTYRQIECFLDVYGKYLTPEMKNTAVLLVKSKHSLKARLCILKNGIVFRQTAGDNRVARFLVLTGKL